MSSSDSPRAQARATLKFLHAPGDVFELCLSNPASPTGPWQGRALGNKAKVAGWFKDQEKAAQLVSPIKGSDPHLKAGAVYVTLNPCVPAMLARACERLQVCGEGDRTSDSGIAAYRNLLVDIDPNRPAGVSSSEEEHNLALLLARRFQTALSQMGWPEPLCGDSGNGAHLVYPLELENNEANKALIKHVLAGLAAHFAADLAPAQCSLDLKNFNPARLTKLYGTQTRKGDNLPERPWRWARLLSAPAERVPVSRELLEKMAALAPAAPVRSQQPPGRAGAQTGGRLDVEAYLVHYGVEILKVKDQGGSKLYVLTKCLFDEGHGRGEAAIGQQSDGMLFYFCFHNSCDRHTWAEAREQISGQDSLAPFLVGGQATRQKGKLRLVNQGESPAPQPPGQLGKDHGPAPPDEGEPKKIFWVGHYYFVEKGRLCLEQYDRSGMPRTTYLANFQAVIEEEICCHDGIREETFFKVSGRRDNGAVLTPTLITAKDFKTLNWLGERWGARTAAAPGRNLGPHLVSAIQAHSGELPRRVLYGHTGWQQGPDGWRYLHGAGALGPGEPLEVDLGGNLRHYALPAEVPDPAAAVAASLAFLEIGPWEITAPLLAAAYLAPFADLLKIDFSLWLHGPTGSMKSTLAALALCHFGDFDRLSLPGSWFSTVNSLERLCFTLKDTLVVIDDFMPSAGSKEAAGLSEKAGRLIYQAGNRSGRGRLMADMNSRPNYFPRGLLISTGEMLLPGQRQSATARYLALELNQTEKPLDRDRLTAAQAEKDLYAQALAAYLLDLAPDLESHLAGFRELWRAYRAAFQNGGHLRLPEIQAWLAVGLESFCAFAQRLGVLSESQAAALLKRAWQVLEELGARQSRLIASERPTIKFMAVLKELFYQGKVYVEDVAGCAPPRWADLGWEAHTRENGETRYAPCRNAVFLGWADQQRLYLLPEAALKEVKEMISRQQDYLALGRNEMYQTLGRERYLEPGPRETTQVKKIQGSSRRVIVMPVVRLMPEENCDAESGPAAPTQK